MLNMTPNEMPSTGTAGPQVEAGVYPGVISLIVDLGVQRNIKFDSQKKAEADLTDKDYDVGRFFWYSFALPTERYEVEAEDGEVYERDQILGKQYKISKSDKSNLIIMYKALVKDGRSFGEMIGMPCTVSTGTTSGGKAKVTAIAPPMRGTQVAAPLKAPMIVSEDMWSDVDSLDIPDFLKEMIKNRVE